MLSFGQSDSLDLRRNVLFVVLLSSLGKAICQESDAFYESMTMDVLGNNYVYSFFNFTTTLSFKNNFDPQHYGIFPRSFGELMQKYQVAELHFTMTQGLWRYSQWGMPDSSVPTGAQLWVWFDKGTKNVDEHWVGFTNALSGIFCASLNFINKAKSVTPVFSFRPTGALKGGWPDNKYLRHGTLSREILCTENLTPWLKLLPCGSHAGPASLLNPSQLHHSKFLSMGIHYSTQCSDPDCVNTFVQLQQHVSVVFDIRTSLDQMPDFSFITLFQRKLKPACKIATSSHIKLQVPRNAVISPQIVDRNEIYSILDLSKLSSETNFMVKWKTKPFTTQTPLGIISHCFLTGLGLEGGLTCSLTNNLPNNVSVVFFQVVPWFLYTQLHTLEIETSTGTLVVPQSIDFQPGKIRESPQKLELILTLQANDETNLKIKFTRGFLAWTEHPPDANHGFYISPACVTLKSSDLILSRSQNWEVQRIYSEALLVNIPVPDFSMPYNVICLVCTVIAVAFGSLHNLTTRRLQKVSLNKKSPVMEKLDLIMTKIGLKSRSAVKEIPDT